MVRNFGLNIALIFASLLFSIFLIEITLRIFHPKYQYAADAKLKQDNIRIWSRSANSHGTFNHPDSGVPHAVIHNNLALRQHRDFSKDDIETAVNIGFFGDSFTENSRIPVQYSFTEPLDYLLNLSEKRFNVLNFGVDGYGTDQCFLYYKELEFAKDLDYVFYVFCVNDLRNIHVNNIFSHDKSGSLVMNSIDESPWWIKAISKLHFTYLSLKIIKTLFPNSFNLNDQAIKDYFSQKEYKKRIRLQRAGSVKNNFGKELVDKNLKIFIPVIRSWQQLVEKNGGEFYIVLLPRHWESLISDLINEDFRVINLFETFSNTIDNYNYSDWKLKNDLHWNEAANSLTAIHLYQFLENEANLPTLSFEKVEEALYTYYSAFSNGWVPDMFVKKVPVSSENITSIRNKYLALESNNSIQ